MEQIIRALLDFLATIIGILFFILFLQGQVLLGIFIVLVVLFLSYLIRKPDVEGYFGEREVRQKLKHLDPVRYIVLNNIILKRDNGKSTEIDHLVLSLYGIFIIETKNVSGAIYGSEDSHDWTKYMHKVKWSFDNPILQNNVHEKRVREILEEFKNLKYYPMIVFSPKSEIHVKADYTLVHTDKILKEITQYTSEIMTPQQLIEIYKKIKATEDKRDNAREEHIEYVKKK